MAPVGLVGGTSVCWDSAVGELPLGMRVVVDRRARRLDGGAALLGGAPPRLVHLVPKARALLGAGNELTVADPLSRALARTLLDAGLAHPAPGIPGGPTRSEVTVVVPVKDRPLDRLLATLPPEVDLVVVDDGSAEPVTLARGRVIRHETARGPSASRNAGLAAATTPLVMFLDSDVVPQGDWLDPLLEHLADRSVALVAPRIVALHPVTTALGRYEAVRSSLDLGPDPALIVPRSRVAYVPSAAMLVRTSAVGTGFDEAMHVAEDVDLVLRLHAAGHRLRYEPRARVAHDHRTAPKAWAARKAFYGTGAAPLARRHVGSVPPLVLSPWTAAACAALLAQRRWSVPVAAAVTAAAALRLSRKLTRLAHPRRSAMELAGLGLSGAVVQVGNALLRHHWPIAVGAALGSRRARRALVAAALVEGLADWWLHRDRDPQVHLDPLTHLVAHRIDDLAYGAGLWWGALRACDPAALLPVGPGTPSKGVAPDR
ncbi:mycofactocin system glycosyltransferase [Pseudonocardia oroxyli]|uniref:Mycofactocin system glycosyltransferase n=1 Tax=Pseudonocardia oroxyli TaxID=366584 RepID=A0A1G7FSH2_PSEOR|nr:mycofactocin system glycosyltransferase [Pseudonocardia oroxyli]